MADLYAAANQDSGVSSYISAASPAPSTGFGHSLGVGPYPSAAISHTHIDVNAHVHVSLKKLTGSECSSVCILCVHPQGPLIATAFTNGYH